MGLGVSLEQHSEIFLMHPPIQTNTLCEDIFLKVEILFEDSFTQSTSVKRLKYCDFVLFGISAYSCDPTCPVVAKFAPTGFATPVASESPFRPIPQCKHGSIVTDRLSNQLNNYPTDQRGTRSDRQSNYHGSRRGATAISLQCF